MQNTSGMNLREHKPTKGILMMRSFLITLLLVATVAANAVAGTIEGKVSPGKSVVYVDNIGGKTFPAPTQTALIEHKGMTFSPHTLVIQQGTTVEFLNRDNMQHNVCLLYTSEPTRRTPISYAVFCL